MPETNGRTRARLAVIAELAHREWTPARLATQSGADPGTIGDFLNGKRWIKLPTQGKVERALGWPAGTISAIDAGAEPPSHEGSVSGDDETPLSQWLTREMSDLTDGEQEELWEKAAPILEALKRDALSRRTRGSTLGDS